MKKIINSINTVVQIVTPMVVKSLACLLAVFLLVVCQEALPKAGEVHMANTGIMTRSYQYVTVSHSNEVNLGIAKMCKSSDGYQLLATPFSNGYVRVYKFK